MEIEASQKLRPGSQAESKVQDVHVYTYYDRLFNPFNLSFKKVISADLLLGMQRRQNKKVSQGPGLTFQLCASQRFPVDTRTRAGGLKVTTD